MPGCALRHALPALTHGFALSDNPKYDRASAERAWAATLDLLREKLK